MPQVSVGKGRWEMERIVRKEIGVELAKLGSAKLGSAKLGSAKLGADDVSSVVLLEAGVEQSADGALRSWSLSLMRASPRLLPHDAGLAALMVSSSSQRA
jgi:hypothetical protein